MAKPCANCGAAGVEQYCPACGQKNVDLHPPLRDLVSETIEDAVGFDSRLRHTVIPFLFRPGVLTREFIAGRRARYTSPLKLFIVLSTLFFLLTASAFRAKMAITAPVAFDLEKQQPAAPASSAAAAPASPHRGRFSARLRAQAEPFSSKDPAVRAAAGQAYAGALEAALPKAVFLLVPVFALLVALVERKKGHVYVSHLVFSLHLHAFFFAVALLASSFPERWDTPVGSVAVLVAVAYAFRALRVVYGDGAWRASFKVLAVGAGYLVAVMLTVSLIMVGELAIF